MKRHLLPTLTPLLFVLLAGAAISVAVAEGAMLWSPTGSASTETLWTRPRSTTPAEPEAETRDMRQREKMLNRLSHVRVAAQKAGVVHPDNAFHYLTSRVGIGFDTDELYVTWIRPLTDIDYVTLCVSYTAVRSGWPMRCLTASGVDSWSSIPSGWVDAEPAPAWLFPRPLFVVAPRGAPAKLLPTPLARTLIPIGLAVNTVFYAAILLLPATLGFGALVRSRRRRNHCPACNYNLRGLAADALCPECGPD